jgi:hypothetical protein
MQFVCLVTNCEYTSFYFFALRSSDTAFADVDDDDSDATTLVIRMTARYRTMIVH